MTCCGKGIVKKAVSIVKGNILNSLFILPKSKYEFADTRLSICRVCEKSTWMTKTEFTTWLWQHKIEVIRNLDDLTILPELPRQEYKKGRLIFCMLCKCYIPAKTFVDTEICPLSKW